jgi:16S rRNA (guanine527-N7)-methyltransferase
MLEGEGALSYLSEEAEKQKIIISKAQSQDLIAYLCILERWNRVHNFSRVFGMENMIQRHILESLHLIPYLCNGNTVGDLGSGPGLPGLPLAIACPKKTVVLIEVNKKRVAFLRHVVAQLSLKNVCIEEGKAPALSLEKHSLDCIVARAFGSLEDLMACSSLFLKQGGSYVLLRGSLEPKDEVFLKGKHYFWEIHSLRDFFPGSAEKNVLVVCSRQQP